MPVLNRTVLPVLLALALLGGSARGQDAGPQGGEPRADLQGALVADIDFDPPVGIISGQTFGITVAFRSAVASDPPKGLDIRAWLRPISPTNLPCSEAASVYRQVSALPNGAVDLRGTLIATAMQDGSLTITDPNVNLASANILAAARLDAPADMLVADPWAFRFLAAAGDAIWEIDPLSGDKRRLSGGFDRITTLFAGPDGSVWVLDAGKGLLYVVPAKQGRMAVAWEKVSVAALSVDGRTVAIAGAEKTLLINSRDKAVLARFPGMRADAVVTLDGIDGTTGLAALDGRGRVVLRYADAPDYAQEVELAGPATQLVAEPQGRYLFAFDPSGGPVSIIDVARGRLRDAIAADVPISDVAFTDRLFFLLRADQAALGMVPFDDLPGNEPLHPRELLLGQAADVSPDSDRLTSFGGGTALLAVHGPSSTGFVFPDDPAMLSRSTAMTSVQLRGGSPRHVASLDRDLTETTDGRFESRVRLPSSAGGWELVVREESARQSFCAEVPTAVIAPDEARGPGRITAASGEPLYLTLIGPDGLPVSDVQARLSFFAPEANWRRDAQVTTDASGRIETGFRLPRVRPIIITAVGPGRAFNPLVIEE